MATKKRSAARIIYNTVCAAVLLAGMFMLLHEPIQSWFVSRGTSSLGLDKVAAASPEKRENSHIRKQDPVFNFEEVSELDFETILMANLNKDDIHVIGGISIPSIDMNLPIGEGVAPYTLALTAGTMKPDQVMGEGNYALAGHHMNRKDLLFSPLLQVKTGAPAYLTDMQYIYEYKIEEQKTIEATAVEVIEDQGPERLLTLITCDDSGKARVLTRGRFVGKTPIQEATKEMKDAFQLEMSNL
ncbi:class A sortase [Paenibacillus dendritiformis]|uniref:class A sortase n=1 Tax=Paenibacillus dendritiformis TaxID=130049 RepID=UPI00366848B5